MEDREELALQRWLELRAKQEADEPTSLAGLYERATPLERLELNKKLKFLLTHREE